MLTHREYASRIPVQFEISRILHEGRRKLRGRITYYENFRFTSKSYSFIVHRRLLEFHYCTPNYHKFYAKCAYARMNIRRLESD